MKRLVDVVRRRVRDLARDEHGSAVTNVLSMATAMPVAVGFSFLTMQLFQSSYHRDMVDHAASVAADAMTKSLCSNTDKFGGTPRGAYTGARQAYVEERVRSQMAQVGSKDKWRITAKPGTSAATTPDLGSMPMDVEVAFDAPCSFPFAAQILCEGSPRHLSLKASQSAVAMGCDAGEEWGAPTNPASVMSALSTLGNVFQQAATAAMQVGEEVAEQVAAAQATNEQKKDATPADDRSQR